MLMSELLQEALNDLDNWSGKVDMGVYLARDPESGICTACLAGAWLARQGNFEYGDSFRSLCHVRMGSLDVVTSRRIDIIDHLRMGHINIAMHIATGKYVGNPVPMVFYGEPGWREYMDRVLGMVKEHDCEV